MRGPPIPRLRNHTGSVAAEQQLRIDSSGDLRNAGGLGSSAGTIDVNAATLGNRGGTLLSGGKQNLGVVRRDATGRVQLQGDITGRAQSIAITAAQDTSHAEQTTKFKQSGLSVSLNAPVVEAAAGAVHAAGTVGQSRDGRVNALAAANAAYDGYQAVRTVSDALSSGQTVGLAATIGSQQSSSHTQTDARQAIGSTVKAGGRVDLAASGAGQDSAIRVWR